MNKIRLSAYMMAFMAAGFSGCTNDVEMPVDSKGTQTVMMTVDVSRSADDTRSSLSQVDDDLACVWTEDDKLLVTSTDGSRLGVLTIKSINSEDKSKATFSGKLENVANGDKVTVNYIYLGNKGDYTTVPTNNVYSADYSKQDGTIESLSDHDIMTKQAQAIIENGCSYVDGLVMERRVSFARFKLNLPDGVTFDQNTTVTVSGDGVNNALSFNGGTLVSAYTAGTVTITPGKNDFYMTLLPNTLSSVFDLTFTVSTADAAYTGVYQVSKTIAQGKFYRKDNSGNPIEVTLTKVPKTYNPGDPESWGSNVDIPNKVKTTSTYWDFIHTHDSNDDSRYTNCRDIDSRGGWATWTEYTNGIVDNILATENNSAIYFQWGRIMGFPYNVSREPDIFNGMSTPYNFGSPAKLGYVSAYEVGYMSWSMNAEKAHKYPYVYLKSVWNSIHLDWSKTNDVCKWEDRSGNPCPDGYRVPTAEEMSVFVPDCGTVVGSYTQVKNIKGKNVAIEWVVTPETTYQYACVSVRMAPTDKSSVKVNDPIFSNSRTIKFYPFGYLMNDGVLSQDGEIGMYWTSDTGDAGDLLDDVSGNGGKVLFLSFSGNQVTIDILGLARSFGVQVMPIKDDKAKSIMYRPWFPYGEKWPK